MSLPTLKIAPYSNWVIQGLDGTPLCRAAEKRARWYLDRDLADIVELNVVRLRFVPKGPGSQHLAERSNRCVVCGTEVSLTKHHIVPSMYRVHLPHRYKSRNSHDVVAICSSCHMTYEAAASKFKIRLGNEYGLPHQVTTKKLNTVKSLAQRSARILMLQGDKIPLKRQAELLVNICLLLGTSPTAAAIESLSALPRVQQSASNHHGEALIKLFIEQGRIDEFVQVWRQHFLDVAQPKFMPSDFDVTY